MTKGGYTNVRLPDEYLRDLRVVKSYLTIELNQDVPNHAAFAFMEVERVLGTDTTFYLVEQIRSIREHEGSRSLFSVAIEEVMDLFHEDPENRKPMIENLRERYEKMLGASNEAEGSEKDQERFFEILDRIEGFSSTPLLDEYMSD